MSIAPQRPGPTPEHPHHHEVHEHHDVQHLHAPIMREQQDPRDGFEPIPMPLIFFFGALLFFGGFYLQRYSGDFRADEYFENRRPTLPGAAAVAEKLPPREAGREIFLENCAACHQATGLGQPGSIPPLDGSEWVLGPKSRLGRILVFGLSGPVEVKGSSYNGNMPNFGTRAADPLGDEQIANVLTYVRSEWGNKADAIAPEAVAAARAAYPAGRGPMTADELKQINAEDKAAPAAEKASGAKADEAKKPAGP
jgi:mono/diheme cytochrome c family protein